LAQSHVSISKILKLKWLSARLTQIILLRLSLGIAITVMGLVVDVVALELFTLASVADGLIVISLVAPVVITLEMTTEVKATHGRAVREESRLLLMETNGGKSREKENQFIYIF
jgi:hypothetical protein